MVKYISDRIGVMYYGKLVEVGQPMILYTNPLHPYTQSFYLRFHFLIQYQKANVRGYHMTLPFINI